MFMYLGPVPLDIFTVKSLSNSDSWSYAEHAVIEGKPRLQHTGTGLRTASLGIRLRREWGSSLSLVEGGAIDGGGPELLLDELRALADLGLPLPLLRGNGRLTGLFVITGLEEKPLKYLPRARAGDIEATLTLKEYEPGDGLGGTIAKIAGGAMMRRLPSSAASWLGNLSLSEINAETICRL